MKAPRLTEQKISFTTTQIHPSGNHHIGLFLFLYIFKTMINPMKHSCLEPPTLPPAHSKSDAQTQTSPASFPSNHKPLKHSSHNPSKLA